MMMTELSTRQGMSLPTAPPKKLPGRTPTLRPDFSATALSTFSEMLSHFTSALSTIS